MKLKLRKGLSLNIKGALKSGAEAQEVDAGIFAVVPDDFPGFTPKVAVKEGDVVAVGSPLLFDKENPDTKIVSPISGTVKAIVRGERRKIMRVEVARAQVETTAQTFDRPKDHTTAINFLAESGLLVFLRRRPYDIIPRPGDEVRDIFITAIDNAPLAPSLSLLATQLYDKSDFEEAVELLSHTTSGKIYFCRDEEWQLGPLKGTEDVVVEGPYPSGNVGVQIANIKPIDKGDVVWTLDVMTLGRIGRTLRNGVFDSSAVVACVGPEVKEPTLYKSILGAPVQAFVSDNIAEDGRNHRVISGNVFTGVAVDMHNDFIRYPYRQITIIAEGDDVDEFMGWASLSPKKMSQSRTFPGHFLKRMFSPDARLNGGRRAMIMSGEYERVVPIDIIPEYLIKAIISRNIEDMEKLGIYEVAPEDFAAAEYVDTSKLPLQAIVREGLDYLRKELE
ncbi:MAG: NADH:ubiquinone reductase (Na(+)-transporting) subunit A [Muribaculaceae bacterium]|nr:NADH:ubiquinone reductase (Na(+)-transporting) subunit A [Muribaculaceae bacterium]